MRISFNNNESLFKNPSITSKSNVNLNSLNIGDIFEGEILDIRQNHVLIKLASNQQLMAKLMDQLELTIGQKLLFEIKQKNEEQIIIKPHISNMASPQEQKVFRALDEAGLSATDKNIELVKALIENQQPINKSNLLKFNQYVNTYDNESIESLVTLEKHSIPINKENLIQLNNYENQTHSLLKNLSNIVQDLTSSVEKLINGNYIEQAINLHEKTQEIIINEDSVNSEKNIINVNNSNKESSNNKLLLLTQQQKTDIIEIVQKNDISFNIEKLENDLNIKDFFKDLKQLPEDKKQEFFSEFGKTEVFKKIIEKQLLNEWSLFPKEFNKDLIQDNYEKIEIQTKKLMELLTSTDTDLSNHQKSIKENHQDIKQNIDFVKLLNQSMQYLQIPLKMNDQYAHSDLYILNNKNNLKRNSKNITAIIHLDLASLGEMDIFIDKKDKLIQTQFYTSQKETKGLLQNNMHQLVNQLNSKGYSFYAEVKESKKSVDFVNDFLNSKQSNNTQVKRYSFDIRV